MKILTVLLGSLILIGCGETSTEPSTDEALNINRGIQANQDNNIEIEPIEIGAFDELVSDTLFFNASSEEAWNHYKEITKLYTLGDTEALDGNGSTSDEVEEMMASIVDEPIELDEAEYEDGTEMLTLVYPLDSSEEDKERRNVLGAIYFYFMEDELVFSALTPTTYLLDEDRLYDIEEDLLSIGHLDELKALNPLPQVFGVSEYNFHGEHLRQILLATAPHPDLTSDETGMLSFIFYEAIVADVLAGRFEVVSQNNFADSSYVTFRDLDFSEE